MSQNIKINFSHNPTINFVHDLMIDPKRSYDSEDKNSIYYTCPAWSHKLKRTFDIFSPIDMRFELANGGKFLSCSTMEQEVFDQYVELQEGWCDSSRITIQINHIFEWFFWSKHKNLWIHVQPHPLTASSNLYAVEAWFNLSAWFRATSFAFNVIDPSKPIHIKRGSPVYRVSFYTDNLDNTISLVKSEIPEKMLNEAAKRPFIQGISKNLSNKLLFVKQDNKKCPFNFLFKND